MKLPFVFPPQDKYPLFFNSFLVFLDPQLLLLLPHSFCPGDPVFCAFIGERAGDGMVAPMAKGSLLFVPPSALLHLPPPPHHGICALCVAVVLFPQENKILSSTEKSFWLRSSGL